MHIFKYHICCLCVLATTSFDESEGVYGSHFTSCLHAFSPVLVGSDLALVSLQCVLSNYLIKVQVTTCFVVVTVDRALMATRLVCGATRLYIVLHACLISASRHGDLIYCVVYRVPVVS